MPEATAQPGIATAQFQKFALAAALLTLVFALPLWRLFRFAIADDLHSYIPLMPLVSGYLAWTLKPGFPRQSAPARAAAAFFFTGGAAAAGGYWLLAHSATPVATENVLAWATLAWLLGLTGAGCWILGGATMRALVYPCFLLGFMIPFPTFLRVGIETGLQYGSAAAADWMFTISGTPLLRQGLVFILPGITPIDVAPECSGIHSTLVLFITSLVAARMVLTQNWRRAVLCLAVIPLALLRNGFRVFVLGELCVHVSPKMIDSPIHHHGGPLFFVLSLGPFFLLLYFLRKGEPNGDAGPLLKPEK